MKLVQETKRVQQLAGNCYQWEVDQRPKDYACLDDLATKVKGVDKKKVDALIEVGARTVVNLVTSTNPPQGFAPKMS